MPLAEHVDPTEAELRLFWDGAGVLFCIIDEGRFTSVNEAWTDLLGWREDQLLGRRPQEFLHPDDADTAQDGAEQTRLSGRVIDIRNRYRHADGSVRWLQWTGHMLEGRWYGVARDVTAMESAHTALQRSERRSRATVTALREGLVISDATGRLVEANARFAEMTGWAVRELLDQRPPYPWLPPDATLGQDGTRELTLVRRDGSRFRALVDQTPLQERGSAHDSTLAVIRDVTELTETRDRLRAAHEVARMSSWEWFDEGDRVVVNYDGMRPEMPPRYELTGADVLRTLAMEDRELARRMRDETAAGTRPGFAVDLRVASSTIDVAWVEWRARPLHDADGTIIGVCGTAQDISARKHAELHATSSPGA